MKVMDSEDPEYTGHIPIGVTYEGTIRNAPEVGECFYLDYDDGERCFRTSPVVEIIDRNIFKTLNSIYKLEIVKKGRDERMRGLIACEESQVVTKAFREKQHEFYSNDLIECSGGKKDWHYQRDCFEVIEKFGPFEFLGMHPVCRLLANSGVRWLASKTPRNGFEWSAQYSIYINWDRYAEMKEAALFFIKCLESIQKVGKGYVENPIMHKYAMEIVQQRPSQIIQPWQFGHGEKKATCLWIVGLPLLQPSNIVEGREQRVWKMPPSPDRAKLRSKTFPGIAAAMAAQWSE